MSLDDEIRAHERSRPPAGADTKEWWSRMDLLLVRAELPPRRVWGIEFSDGEYSDRQEGVLEPLHWTRDGALAHLAAEAREMGLGLDPGETELNYHRGERLTPDERGHRRSFQEGSRWITFYEIVQ